MDNVIRFPRDWFGSKDDLVPFGPAADRLEAAAAAEIDREGDDDLSDALTANDFWGEGAGALHQPVGVPEDEAAPTLELVEEPTAPTAPATSVASRRPLMLIRRGWLSGLAVGAMLICAVGVFLLDQTHSSPPASPRTLAHSQVGARGGVDVSEVADLLATQTIREAGRAAALATQSIERARAKRHALAVRRTKSARRTAVDESRAHTPLSSSVSDSSDSSPSVTDSSSVVSSPPVSKPADTSSSSSSASSPLAPGPTTAGSAGSNCNPQCR